MFSVAHVHAKYESLQVKYNEEKAKTARLQQDIYRMEGQLEEVKTDRAKVVMQLSEKVGQTTERCMTGIYDSNGFNFLPIFDLI